MPKPVAEREDILPALAEVFREHGYEGASLRLITERTGLGKGSLYHFFPGGKADMAAAVLADIDAWFEARIFAPLETGSLEAMFDAVSDYFQQGRRVCLMGAFALNDSRDRFPQALRQYFERWRAALTECLKRDGQPAEEAQRLAEDMLGGIQGAIILSRALGDERPFREAISRLKRQGSQTPAPR